VDRYQEGSHDANGMPASRRRRSDDTPEDGRATTMSIARRTGGGYTLIPYASATTLGSKQSTCATNQAKVFKIPGSHTHATASIDAYAIPRPRPATLCNKPLVVTRSNPAGTVSTA
jgi:hypothetical protein